MKKTCIQILKVFYLFNTVLILLPPVFIIFLLIIVIENLMPKKIIDGFSKLIRILRVHFIFTLFAFYFQEPIIIGYDSRILNSKRILLASNHICEYDWVFYMLVAYFLQKESEFTIIIKEEIRQIPVIGRILEFLGDHFLTRNNKEQDIDTLNCLAKALSEKENFMVLVFPEGTYISAESLEKSQKYVKNNKVEFLDKNYCPENVLVPRILGFNILKTNLQMDGTIDSTLFTNPSFVKEIADVSHIDYLVYGQKQFTPFISLKYYQHNEVEHENFLFEIFKEKDRIIQEYHEKYFRKLISKEEVSNLIKLHLRKNSKEQENDRIVSLHIPRKTAYLMCFVIGIFYCYFLNSCLRIY